MCRKFVTKEKFHIVNNNSHYDGKEKMKFSSFIRNNQQQFLILGAYIFVWKHQQKNEKQRSKCEELFEVLWEKEHFRGGNIQECNADNKQERRTWDKV